MNNRIKKKHPEENVQAFGFTAFFKEENLMKSWSREKALTKGSSKAIWVNRDPPKKTAKNVGPGILFGQCLSLVQNTMNSCQNHFSARAFYDVALSG